MRRSLALILALAAVVFGSGLTWGLPHYEDWQSDSLTPYHPLVGLGQLYSFGYFHKYPLVQQVVLGVLDIPVVIVALIDSIGPQGFSLEHFARALRSAEYATPLLVIGRLVTVAMAIATVYFVYRMTRGLSGHTAALWAALLLCLNSVMNHLAVVAKVDVPYVFWAVVSLCLLVEAHATRATRTYVLSALTACLSFGTKDQAYAIFVLPWIALLVVEPLALGDRSVPWTSRLLDRPKRAFVVAFVAGTLAVENVLLNWAGLMKRIGHLTGDAGFRSAAYSTDVQGVLALLVDCGKNVSASQSSPLIFALCAAGVAFVALDKRLTASQKLVRFVPLLASFSYYLFFVQIVRQAADRFALFPSVALIYYAGVAVSELWQRASQLAAPARRVAQLALGAVLAVALAHAAFTTAQLDIDLLHDPRYEAERYMAEEVEAGARVEYYGYLHYLPRFPANVRPYRIKSGVLELEQRAPDYIVLSSLDYDRYFGTREAVSVGGRLAATARRVRDRTSDFPELYRRLFSNELPYDEVRRFERPYTWITRHPSVPALIRIYKRRGA